jgi:hypothetical protein
MFPCSLSPCSIKNIMDDRPKRSFETAVVKALESCSNCMRIPYSECLGKAYKYIIRQRLYICSHLASLLK